MLIIGTILLLLIGIIHSYLGEKYIIIRLLRRENLPKLQGSDWFTKRILRFAWHITTLAWWGFAAILYVLVEPSENVNREILLIITVVFAVSGLTSALFSHGKHLSWLFFFSIAAISYYGAIYS